MRRHVSRRADASRQLQQEGQCGSRHGCFSAAAAAAAAAAGRFSLAGRVKLDYTSVGFAVGTRHRVLGCARGVEGTGSGVLGAVLTTAQLGQGSVQGA